MSAKDVPENFKGLQKSPRDIQGCCSGMQGRFKGITGVLQMVAV